MATPNELTSDRIKDKEAQEEAHKKAFSLLFHKAAEERTKELTTPGYKSNIGTGVQTEATISSPKEDLRTQEQKDYQEQYNANLQLNLQRLQEAEWFLDFLNAPYNPVRWIPGIYTLGNINADNAYSRVNNTAFTPYTIPGLVSSALDATLLSGTGPASGYVSGYVGESIGRKVGEHFGNGDTGAAIGGLAGGISGPIFSNITRPYRFGLLLNYESKHFPIFREEPLLNVGWGPKQTINVTNESNHTTISPLYNGKRWDVVNEGANPFGIWWTGLLGIPRTTETGNTAIQAQKAVNARNLFAKRPYTYSGELQLNKPMITVGDVPDRSRLSWFADEAGADGLVYNDVYDNGYNNNLVILGFKYPDNIVLYHKPNNLSFSTNSNNKFSYWTGPKTTWDNFNIPEYKKDLLAGKLEFIDWINNPEYSKAMQANKEEAESMGLFYTPILETPEYLLAITNFRPRLHFNLPGANGQIDFADDYGIIHLSSVMNNSADNVTRHELAHSARLAYPTSKDLNTAQKLIAYLRFKNSQVFDDLKADLTDVAGNRFYDFGSKGYAHEAVSNARDLGAEYGIKVGQEYPGDLQVLDLLKKMHDNQEPGSFRAKFIEALRTDKEHLKYVWKALNGTLWGILPFIVGATMLDNR